MRIAYLDCASGISGDMTLGALIDAGADLAGIQAAIDSLGLPSCRLSVKDVKKKGFRAAQLTVEHEPEHKHRHLHHIADMIDRSRLTTRQRELATRVFRRLAEAEAKVHGSTIEKVHFHEVGAVDSIADIVGTAVALELLGVERIICSPIPTGRGFVEIAHGRCAIPAPATGELLRGAPLAALDVEGELTTPTGAAIVAALADGFGPLPSMSVERIGYGAGRMELPQANILRILIGSSCESLSAAASGPDDIRPKTETLIVLEANLDDSCGTELAHAVEQLRRMGALDASLTPVQMKKGRPGVVLSVQARPADADRLEAVMFAETTTLGVRRTQVTRTVLARQPHEVTTAWGMISGKLAWLPDGRPRFSPEYEACRAIAERHGVPLAEVTAAAAIAFGNQQA